MVRLFSLLSAIAVLMIITAGAGVYWFGAGQIAKAKQDSAEAVAKSVALGLTGQITLLTDTLEKMAQDPEVLAAVTSADKARIDTVAERLEKYLPGTLKIRLLLPGISELDDKSVPKMGYADLDIVRETFTQAQLPAIHVDNGVDRHLAITRRIMQNNQVAGVLLASLNYDFISKTLQAADLKDGYLELKQATLVLGNTGVQSSAEQDDAQMQVANTRWELHYQYPDKANFSGLADIIGMIAIFALLALLTFFIGYRRLSGLLRQDLSTVLKAYKDMMTNKLQGTYPVMLPEMNAVVSTLVQFQRVMNNLSDDVVVSDSNFVDLETSSFFDDFDAPLSVGGRVPWMGEIEHKPETVKDTEYKSLKVDTLADADTTTPRIGAAERCSEQLPPATPGAIADDFRDAGGRATQEAVAETFIKPNTRFEDFPSSIPDSFDMISSETAAADSIFRAYDIRGIVDKTLTKEIVYDIGRALGTQIKAQDGKTVVVGWDGRISSPALAVALIQGIISTGLNVMDIGMVPTPVLYFVAKHTEGRSGVMITGSHNPADYNGLKMVINDVTLFGDSIQQLKTCIAKQAYSTDKPGKVEQNTLVHTEYIGIISEYIHIDRPMTVVLDCGNGVAGELGPTLLRTLGCEVIELFCDINGTFPNHHPDPSDPENLTELITKVKHYKADIGIAFDGDGDRLGVVDSNGKIIWPDRQMMLFAKNVLAGNPGAQIIYDVRSTRHLAEEIKKYGGRSLMCKSGHSLIKAKLKETGAKLAGEMSGHIFFNDRWFGFDDALYSASRLLEILSRDTRSSADVFADFPDSINTPELNIELKEGENFAFIDKLFATANFPDGKITDLEGLRVDFPDGWGLVRASNTTGALVIRFEADTEAAMIRIQEQFRQLMEKIKSDIVLPF